jgi:hypothetical protein
MQLTEQDKVLLSKLREAGVTLLVVVRGKGWTPLEPDQLEEYLGDRVKFEAEVNEVSVEQFRKWLDFEEGERRCISLTRKGTRCKGYIHPCYKPSAFVDGVTDCCEVHRQHGLTHERKG